MSTLHLYRTLLGLRHELPALGEGTGTIAWDDTPDGVLSFTRAPGFRCVANLSAKQYPLPAGRTLAASQPFEGSLLPADTAVWMAT